jgi:glutamate dehydrogenase/leucine dehydrogenase
MVRARLEQKMITAFEQTHTTAQKFKVNNRIAAYIVVIQRVVEAMQLRGWV